MTPHGAHSSDGQMSGIWRPRALALQAGALSSRKKAVDQKVLLRAGHLRGSWLHSRLVAALASVVHRTLVHRRQ